MLCYLSLIDFQVITNSGTFSYTSCWLDSKCGTLKPCCRANWMFFSAEAPFLPSNTKLAVVCLCAFFDGEHSDSWILEKSQIHMYYSLKREPVYLDSIKVFLEKVFHPFFFVQSGSDSLICCYEHRHLMSTFPIKIKRRLLWKILDIFIEAYTSKHTPYSS